jgi:hypothetical protein
MHKKLLLFTLLLTVQFVVLAQSLTSISTEKTSSTITTNTFETVTDASVTLDITGVNKILVIATFNSKTLSGTAEAGYRIADNADANGINSGTILRTHNGKDGIGSVVYIFDVSAYSGNRTYVFQHKTDAGTLSTTVSITAIALYDGTNQLTCDVKLLAAPIELTTSWVSVLETDAITLPNTGGFYVAASIQNAKTSGGSNPVVGEWVLQYKKTSSGTWTNLSYSISRTTTGNGKGVISLVGALPDNTSANSYYFRVAHHKVSGADQVETQACKLVAIALGSGGSFFPVFNSSKPTLSTTSTSLTPVLATNLQPNTSTKLFLHAQFCMQSNGTSDAPKYDLYIKNGATEIYNGTDFLRYLSSSSDIGSATLSGLTPQLDNGEMYEIDLRHASTTSRSLTTNSAYLCGFGLTKASSFKVPITVNATLGLTSSSYTTLKAAFDDINNGVFRGDITILVNNNTTETASCVLNASGTGSANYTSLLMYPTNSGYSISGNINGNLISLNGADNIIIDGRVNQVGSADLTINNTNTGNIATTVRFSNSAENNTVRYCYLKSAALYSNCGAIVFSTSTSGNGNSNNTIDHNFITGNASGRPYNAIYSSGTSGRENSGIVISNNNIYDFLSSTASSRGINITSNSSNWTISGNSFYETTTIQPSTSNNYSVIYVGTSTNHLITGNYIGGNAPYCGGNAMTINSSFSHNFYGLYIIGGTTTPVTVENNIIQNINYTSTNSNPWDGIYLSSGKIDVIGNTIGGRTGNDSIIITTPNAAASSTISGGAVTAINIIGGGSGFTTAPIITFSTAGSTTPAVATATISGGIVTGYTITNGGAGYTSAPTVYFNSANYSTTHGIRHATTATVSISNNNIGAITTVGNSTYSHCLEPIVISGAASTITISNNLIGSLTTANSLKTASAASASLMKQDLRGIYINATIANAIISDNTIANLTNYYTGTSISKTDGICTSGGSNIIQNNTIRDISACASSITVKGIQQLVTTSSTSQTVTGNTIYNLSNINASLLTNVIGIHFLGSLNGTNTLSKNFIHSLTVSSSNLSSEIDGISIGDGVTTCANNIINLGGNLTNGYKIYGIYDNSSGNASNSNRIYFNSIYIGGAVSAGITSPTAALWNISNSSTRNYRNNIFFNARSGGTTGKHYAIRLAGTLNLTTDYNNYFISGTGGVLGYLSGDKATLAALRTATTKDLNSLNINPVFASAGGTSSDNYYTSENMPGVDGTGTTDDYNGVIRSATPKMGALEANNFVWQGGISNDFGTAGNWSGNQVPLDGTNITFATNPSNSCVLDQNRTLGQIVNAQSTDKLVVNGKRLTLTKGLTFSNGAQIDASASGSIVIFTGTTAQSIPSGSFVGNLMNGLILNNANGLTLNGNLTVEQSLTLTDGAFSIGANTLTLNGSISTTAGSLNGGITSNITIGGNGSNTDLPSVILNNLILNRSNGITLAGNATIAGTLTLSSGTLTIGANTLTISGATPVRASGNINASHSNAELAFLNTTNITLPASLFTGNLNHLTINGAGITASENLTINGVLNLQSANPSATKGLLDMGTSNELTMGANATTIGAGDVIGIIKRVYFEEGNQYTFGNQNSSIMFKSGATALPTLMKVKVSIGTSPWWKSSAINRIYDIIQENGNNCIATFRAFYLESELNNNAENKLSLWSQHNNLPPYDTPLDNGRSNYSLSENWLELADVNLMYFPSSFNLFQISLAETGLTYYTWTGATNTDWKTASNWSTNSVPTSTAFVIIPDAATTPNDPTLPAGENTELMSMQIESGGILNSGSSDNAILSLTHNIGTWSNNGGTFNPGNSTVRFTRDGNSTISGTTSFYNLYISELTTLNMTASTHIKIAGAITINEVSGVRGKLRTVVSGTTIVEYNGSNQTVIIPNSETNRYSTLILSGTGTKTMPVQALDIVGDFDIMGSAIVTAAASLNVEGNSTNDTGATFNSGTFSHIFKGNITNYGTFSGSDNTSMTLSGSSTQNIYGDATINFKNLVIDNSSNVNLYNRVSIDQTLTLSNGNLILSDKNIAINGAITRTNGHISTNGSSSVSFGGTESITMNNDLFSEDPVIKTLIINRSGGVTLGNQNMTVNDSLSLANGTFTINPNTFTLSGGKITRSSGNINASNSGATFVFANDNAIALPTSTFTGDLNNLTLKGLGGVSMQSNITVNGILDLQIANPSSTKGLLDILSPTELTMGLNATTIGLGDVTGIIRRNAFQTGIAYTLGSQYSSILFNHGATRLPDYIKVKITLGTAPWWKSAAVKRVYDIIQVNGANCFATFTARYLVSELNGNTESELSMWSQHNNMPPYDTPLDNGKSNNNMVDKWIELSNVNLMYFPSAFGYFEIGMANTVLVSNTWTGAVSSNWKTAGNWSTNSIPTPTSYVVIPDAGTTTYSPTLPAGENTEIMSIRLDAGGVLNSGATDNALLSLTHNLSTWSNNGGAFNPGNSTVRFIRYGNSTVSGTTSFYNLLISDSTILWLTADAYIQIAGTITINKNDTIQGILQADVSGVSTVEYNGASQTIAVPNPPSDNYSHLVLSGSGIKTLPSQAINISGDFSVKGTVSVTGVSTMNITGNVLIESGATFETGNFEHQIKGNFENNGTFTATSGNSILLNGTVEQSITGTASSAFDKLIINNAAGISLYTNVEVNNKLVLCNGIMNGNANLVVFNANSAVGTAIDNTIPGSATSYINGCVRKVGNTAFTFPIGRNGIYEPAGISAADGGGNSADHFDACYYHTNPDSASLATSQLDTGIDHVSSMEYWTINRSGSNKVYVTLNWSNHSGGITNLPDLIVAHWNSENNIWENVGVSATTGDTSSGSITSALIDSFSLFTIGSKSNKNPLPVSLTSFDAICLDLGVRLIWETASETNNWQFEIERSSNAIDWQTITTTHGAGNSNAPLAYSYIDYSSPDNVYYRLKQVDYDGTVNYSAIISSSCNEAVQFKLYPNPVKSTLWVSTEENIDKMTYEITDNLGLTVAKRTVLGNKINIDVSTYASGLYTIRIYELGKTAKFTKE